MKAWILHSIGDIRLEDTEPPIPSSGEALVRVRAAGICGSDIPRIFRDGAHRMPLVPGHEFSGEVQMVAGEEGKEWTGRRVGVFPLIPCRKCISCRKGLYETCRQYSYLGSRQDGGFAEYVCVPVSNLIELPEEVSFGQAAMLEPMAVAVHAMRRIGPAQEDRVVVCGLGTIGMLLVMFLLERGVKNLYVVGNKDFQKRTALLLGIGEEAYCDSRKEDIRQWLLDRTDGIGADAVFECVGRMDTIALALELPTPAGRVCLVGNPHSDIRLPRDVYWKILRNQLTVTGTWNSSFCLNDVADLIGKQREGSDWDRVVALLRSGRIHPEKLITHHLSMPELAYGLAVMRDKSEDYIKIMLEL